MVGLPAAAFLLCLFGGDLELDGVVTAEARGGEAPVIAGQPSQAGIATVVTPGAQLSYLSARTDLRVDTGVRIFWRRPSGVSSDRPLFLSVTNLSASERWSRRLRTTALLSSSVGEPDYTELSRILGPNQAPLPQGLAEMLSITGRLSGEYQATHRLTLSTSLEATDRRPLGDAATQDGGATAVEQFPRQQSIALTPSLVEQVTHQGSALFTSALSYGTYSTGTEIFTATPLLGWVAHLNRDVDLRAAAGIAYVNVLAVPLQPSLPGLPAPTTSSSISPAGDVEVTFRILTSGDVLVRGSSEAKVDYYADPFLGVVTRRGLFVGGLSVTVAPHWMFVSAATLATALTPHALPGTPPPDETIASASLSARRRVSEHAILEFGGRWADAGPHLSESNLGFHQRQLWLYVALLGSSRRIPQWTVP